MKKVEKTKNNIQAERLNETTRKELFGKFVEAGGRIISDGDDKVIKKDSKQKQTFDREKQLAFKKKEESFRTALKNSGRLEAKKINFVTTLKKPGLLTSLSHKLIIRFRLYILNITDFSGTTFNNKFLQSFNKEYKTSLLRIKLLYLEIFKYNKEIGLQILFKLDKIDPLDNKLIENISGIYNEAEINNITGDYTSSPHAVYSIDKIKEPIITLFRKLYLLKPFSQKIYLAFEKAINTHIDLTGNKSSEYKSKRNNIKNDLYLIFEKLFFSLYWIFCKYNNKIIPLGSYEIDEILKIDRNKKQKPGFKVSLSNDNFQIDNIETEEKEAVEEPKDEINISEDSILPEEIKAGIDLLSRFNLNNIDKLRALYDKSKTFAPVNNNDKILFIYLIFMEFDIEYSFLLTTNKMKYKYGYIGPDNKSLKEISLNLYNETKKCMDLLKEYSNIYELYIKSKNEKPISNERYISYTKNLNTLIKRREQIAHTARYTVLNFMDKVSNIFYTLIEDIKGFNKIIENPEDIIEFEVSGETNKILNKKSIHEALTLAYYFTKGVKYRLDSMGDLSGNLEFDEKEKPAAESEKKEISEKKSNSDTNTTKPDAQSGKIKGESIIDELDDIFSK